MLARTLLCIIAVAAFSSTAGAQIIDYAKYPDLGGQWRPIGGPGRFDISKPAGRGQLAPLTAEYQAIFEANLKDQAAGGQGTTSTYQCLSPGMPRVTNAYGETEFVITPGTTYILMDHILDDRRIFTRWTRLAGRASSRLCSAIPSANGSTARATAGSMFSQGGDPRLSRPAGFRRQRPAAARGQLKPIVKRSGSSSTGRTPRSCMTRSRSSTTR